MRFEFLRPETLHWRMVSSSGVIAAFLCTIALCDAPRLHEQIHKSLGADHECAVTLFAAGHCDHFIAAVATTGPDALPLLGALPLGAATVLNRARTSSILEHAPPSFA